MRIFHSLPVFTFLLTFATAQQPSPDGCVDPAGLVQCLDQEDSDFVDCGVQCNQTRATRNYNDCILGCGNFRVAAYLGCQVQSCWNKIYGCDYQNWALNYLIDNGLIAQAEPLALADEIPPFYPAPDGAPGACSCNIENAYSNLTIIDSDEICFNAAQNLDPDVLNFCQCCDSSRKLSAAINTCPDADLTHVLGLDKYISSAADRIAGKNFDCSEILNNDQCKQQFGFVLGAGTEFFNPTALPPGVPGSSAVSDVGSFTTFPGPQTTTIALAGAYTRVITMVEWKEGESGATGSAASAAVASAKATETAKSGGDGKSAAAGLRSEGLIFVLLATVMAALS